MIKVIIVSIVTTLSTLAIIAQPWLLVLVPWFAAGAATVHLIEKYLDEPESEKVTLSPKICFYLLGPISTIVVLIIGWGDIKSKFKFQSPITKHE